MCNAVAADFAHAVGEKRWKEEGGLLIIHEVSSNFATTSCLIPCSHSRS